MPRLIKTLAAAAALALLATGCATQSFDETDGHRHDEDEILVLNPPEDYLAHLPDLGLEVIDVEHLPGMDLHLYHLRVIDGKHPVHASDAHAEKFPDVIVDVHHHYDHHQTAAEKNYNPQFAATWIGEGNACGKGLTIGIIDGVVEPDHPAFKGSKVTYKSFHLKDQEDANTGHGTSVAAIIGGTGEWAGLLPSAHIYAANVFHEGHNGGAAGSSKAIVRALDWMIHNNVPVVNMSIGGGRNRLIEAAIKHAVMEGMFIVASGGNAGPFSKKKYYPAAYPQVLAVTAVDRFYTTARFASAGDYIEFSAPGVDVWTAFKEGGGKAVSGTSFASPFITAYVAAARERKGITSLAEMRLFLRKNSIDRGAEGRDKYTGWGVVQLAPMCPGTS